MKYLQNEYTLQFESIHNDSSMCGINTAPLHCCKGSIACTLNRFYSTASDEHPSKQLVLPDMYPVRLCTSIYTSHIFTDFIIESTDRESSLAFVRSYIHVLPLQMYSNIP